MKLLYRIPKLNPFFSFNQRIRKEKSFNFDQELFNLSGTEFYLDGYWQTEKYFFDIEHIIKEDFCPLEKLGGQNVAMADLILKNNSVSVHIRRGDYVSNPVTNDFHGICNLDYYNKAIEIIIKKNPDAVFFIFSDDYNWAKENIKNNYKKYFVNFNGREKNYEDIRLMSFCKHNIIANSSFSWWGAWLNNNPGKMVVAPRKWFNKQNINTSDIVPESWIRI